MPAQISALRATILGVAAFALTACATPYTSPIEVTRFVGDLPQITTNSGVEVQIAQDGSTAPGNAYESTFEDAVTSELQRLGYSTTSGSTPPFTANIFVERTVLDAPARRSPVSVGAGGSTGSYGSGVGVGIGINLGGTPKPRELTKLSVRISDRETGKAAWEGRAEIITSTDSQYSDPRQTADVLAKALFKDFPGGNGETITLNAKDLQESQ